MTFMNSTIHNCNYTSYKMGLYVRLYGSICYLLSLRDSQLGRAFKHQNKYVFFILFAIVFSFYFQLCFRFFFFFSFGVSYVSCVEDMLCCPE